MSTTGSNAVEMRGITMQFPGTLANDHIDFSVRKGEIHALIGENGAGKTTLMNILYALYQPTAGQILIDGEEMHFSSPIDAIHAGIGMVHQHFMLVPSMTVAENVVLGIECRRSILFDYRRAVREVGELCKKYGFQIDPEARVADISIGVQQKVEIVKALYRRAEVLILDEPTAVLTPQEITELGQILRDLKRAGKTIIIITHKLKEVMDFSDRITVLRLGKKVGTVETSGTTPEEITVMMVGRHVDLAGHKEDVRFDEVMLEVKDLCLRSQGKQLLDHVSFTLRRGEILGVAGIDGSGQNELTEVLAGYRQADSGQILYRGRDITHSRPRELRRDGFGIIPQGRHELGLVLNMSVEENLLLGDPHTERFTRHRFFLNDAEIAANAQEKIEDYLIKASSRRAAVRTLSGGNQQKVICARETGPDVQLIVANQPTRGVDVGASEQLHHVFVDARNQGKSVLLLSLELDEVMMLSDRIMVMYSGRSMGILDAATATREQIGLLMVGREPGGEEVPAR